MIRYAAGRLLQLVVVCIGVTFIIYVAVWALPGDPIRSLGGNRPLSDSTVAALREQFHLDDPLLLQYWTYLSGLLHGQLGTSFSGRDVSELMADRWPITLQLAAIAWLFEAVFGVVAGLLAALQRGRIADTAILAIGIAVISTPVFVLAYTCQILFGVKLGVFPVAGDSEGARSFILPGLVLATYGMASTSRLMRASVLENLQADYVRTAYSKGLSSRQVLQRHILKNSLIPTLTFLAIDLGYLLGGAIVVEAVFNLPGIGQLLFQSIAAQDGAVVVGVGSLLVLVFLILNLLVDLLHAALDPRVRDA